MNKSLSVYVSDRYLPWLVCCTAMLFYGFNYFLRISPSVIEQELIENLQMRATQVGHLIGFYYYAYTPMQIVVGLIIDRFRLRIVLTLACLMTLFGFLFFIRAEHFYYAAIGRFLIGLGAAFSYITVLKLASVWLPANRFAMVAGMTTALGMISASLTLNLFPHVVAFFGYHTALWLGLMVGGIVCLLIALIVHQPSKFYLQKYHLTTVVPLASSEIMMQLKKMVTNPQMWLIGCVGALFYLPADVFLEFWAVPYLKTVYQLSAQQAGTVVSLAFVGWIIAGPLLGAISDRIQLRKWPLLIASSGAACMIALLFWVPTQQMWFLWVNFFFIGFFCGAHPLCFALGKENNSLKMSGTAIAVTNTLIMAGGAFVHPIVGNLLDFKASGELVNSLPVYTGSDYTFALSVVPLGLLLSVILTLFIKETHCKNKET